MIVLFTGPSLPPSEVPALPEVRVLPPAAQGDVYRAARERPWGIGLIDGFFEHVPAVWHKEILWAMAEGVHVFGASSMGALRAAELADFGMVGVGRVFEQFHRGALTGDDEVALTHLSAEHGYRHASEALVDIRATLDAAVDAGACTRAAADRLVLHAKALFYPQRTWSAVLAAARALPEAAALEGWLPTGLVNQKRRDALALVEAMRAARLEHPGPFRVSYRFEHTDVWEHALPRMRAVRLDVGAASSAALLLDELRLLGDEQLYAAAVHGALARALAEEAAERCGVSVGSELVERTALAFRRTRRLYTAEATAAWLRDQDLDPAEFADLMKREAIVRGAQAALEPELLEHLADQLRAMSCYGRLLDRARAKLTALACDPPGDGVTDQALVRWYFEDQLGTAIPGDLATYAERFGFADMRALLRAVRLEHHCAVRGRTPDVPALEIGYQE